MLKSTLKYIIQSKCFTLRDLNWGHEQEIMYFFKKKKIFFFFSSPLPPILQLNYSGSLETGGVSITFLGWGGSWKGIRERNQELWRGRNTSVFRKQVHVPELPVSGASKGQMLLTVGESKYGGGSPSPEAEKMLHKAGWPRPTHLAQVSARVQMERVGQAGGEAPAAT